MGFIAGSKLLKKPSSAPPNESLQANPIEKTPDNNKEKVDDADNTNDSSKNTSTDDAAKAPDSSDKNETSDNSKVNPNSPGTADTKPVDDSEPKKEAFLTFDDGPTTNITPRILKILDEYNIKATFFVIGQNAEKHPEIIKEEKEKGHAVANHTYSHDYKYIYNNPSNFLKDLEKGDQVLASILGEHSSKIIRFPGGSFGSKRAAYREAVKKAGYTYIDWNALNGDAERLNVPASTLIERVKESTKNKRHVVILMHDAATKKTTADSLPQVIEYLKSQGYEFKTLEQQ
ncbi:polysaccharide deacetylase family protein [Clostridium bovifaecis]|uniref:Polysaccharide deacetylase family protein n=1 Tax=Clostridium bovifaecis TaxID=2184719 RepID=A0A6I6ET04_9CLOT|nr:polysaccharide deacetylase family protein [Clostridium bovifaecis]